MIRNRIVVTLAILALLSLGGSLAGLPLEAPHVMLDDRATGAAGPLTVLDRGGGETVALFITGGEAPGPCLEAAAAVVGARYRTISFALDETTVASCGGREGTRAAIAKLLAASGVGRACVVGCASVAGLIPDGDVSHPDLSGAVFFGEPLPGTISPVPAVYVSRSISPVEVAERVFEFLGPVASERRGPSGWRAGASIPY
jgi:hypothetical protein